MWSLWREVFGEYRLHWAIICASIEIRCDDLDAMLGAFHADLIERFAYSMRLIFGGVVVKVKRSSDEVDDAANWTQ